MHTRSNVVALVTLCSLFATAWLLPEAAASERAREPVRPLAEMVLDASRIDWQPVGDYEHLVLTVAGPKGLWLRKELEAGQPASLSLFDQDGQRFPDGAYTYELRPAAGLVQSGHFSIKNGSFVTAAAKPPLRNVTANLTDDDLIIQGYACIGESCTTTDNDFPVLKLKGQNPNILFDDIEPPPSLLSSSFNDWGISINASDVAKFSIVDVDGGVTPFSILGGAPADSLFISGNGDVGIGTATPAEKLHIVENVDANTIGLIENTNAGTSAAGAFRAKSDTAQVSFQAHGSGRTLTRFGQNLGGWSEFLQVSGNGFAIGTLGATPLLLGTNNTNRVQITAAGSVGVGTTSPASRFHVNGGDIRVSGGSFIDDGTTLNVPDFVFEPDYRLMPLDELRKFVAQEKHLPNVPSANDVKKEGLNLSQVQMQLLEKLEELTLYTLKQDEQFKALQSENAKLNARLQALEQASATEQQ